MNGSETPAEIDEAAADWVARLESGRIGSAERRAMDAWLARSDRHHGAFVRARAMWSGIGADGHDWRAFATKTRAPCQTVSRRGLMAGGIGLAASVGVAFVVPAARHWLAPQRAFATGAGEQRRFGVGGGGSVLLNTDSAVAVDGAGGAVELVRGEALFMAANELAVSSRDALFRAASASFVMALGGFGTRVTVTRGLVRLMVDGSAPFEMGAGLRAEIADGKATVRRIGNEEIGRALAWSQGYLVFAGESLAEAAAMVNRYNRLKVVLGPGVPVGEAVVGRFSIRDPRNFAAAVAKIYGLSMREVSNSLILQAAGAK